MPHLVVADFFVYGKCLDFLDEIYRITSIRITTREVPLLAPTTRIRIEAFPGDNVGEGADEQLVETDSTETPCSTVLRKTSDPKVAKGFTISDHPEKVSHYPRVQFDPQRWSGEGQVGSMGFCLEEGMFVGRREFMPGTENVS